MGARGTVDEVEVPEGCRLEIETDEYGFEVEVIVCDGRLHHGRRPSRQPILPRGSNRLMPGSSPGRSTTS